MFDVFSVFLPGESQGQGSLVAAVHGVAQSRTRLKQLSSSSMIRPGLYTLEKDVMGDALSAHHVRR